MKPVAFPQATVVFAKDQPEYTPLPAHVSRQGVVTSCWALTELELQALLQTKCIWISQLTFGDPLQPQLPSVDKPDLTT
jgi:hypothetical protein